jgi:hypothetical protein
MGDGTIIEPGAQDEIYPGQALPPLLVRTISEDGIQAILGAAIARVSITTRPSATLAASACPTCRRPCSPSARTGRPIGSRPTRSGCPAINARRACPKGHEPRGRRCPPSWSGSAGYRHGCPLDRSAPRLPTTPRMQRCSSARTEGIGASARTTSRGRLEPGWPGSARPIPSIWTPAAGRSRAPTGQPSGPRNRMRTS